MSTPTALSYENRDVAYAVIAPAYDFLARFVPRAVSPNHLTMAGLACTVLAAVVLNVYHEAWICWVAAALVIGYEVFDSLDGKHARNTGQSSRFGAYLDTAIDGLAAGLLYTGLVGHFELYSPIFLFAIAIRMGKACLVYASAAETRLRLNPEIGTTVENLIMVAVLVLSALFPSAALNLGALLPAWQPTLAALQLDTLSWVSGGLFCLVIYLPISCYFDVREVQTLLETPDPEPAAA
jgi:phosphatidylglycerophosphate synthase